MCFVFFFAQRCWGNSFCFCQWVEQNFTLLWLPVLGWAWSHLSQWPGQGLQPPLLVDWEDSRSQSVTQTFLSQILVSFPVFSKCWTYQFLFSDAAGEDKGHCGRQITPSLAYIILAGQLTGKLNTEVMWGGWWCLEVELKLAIFPWPLQCVVTTRGSGFEKRD
jgi:hypothetical protein